MTKRILLLGVLSLFLSAAANAYDFETKNDDGVTIYYNITSDSEATVSYSSYYKYSGVIVIPETVTYGGITYAVTSIGRYAFSECRDLTQITIPGSVITIGERAFESCKGLTKITIPNSVTSIGSNAFDNCYLTEITIPNNVTTIDNFAFHDCNVLRQVTIGESVTTIGSGALQNCSWIESITSLNPEPPTCYNDGVFGNVPIDDCVLYVLNGSKEKYSTADVWRYFKNIVTIANVNAIEDITANGNAEAVGYYTTDGKKVSQPQRGINIIRYSDGTAKKVIVK